MPLRQEELPIASLRLQTDIERLSPHAGVYMMASFGCANLTAEKAPEHHTEELHSGPCHVGMRRQQAADIVPESTTVLMAPPWCWQQIDWRMVLRV